MDFSMVLVIATLASGLIWGGYVLLSRARDSADPTESEEQNDLEIEENRNAETLPVVVEYARSFFPVLLVVLLVRSFLYEPFRIPSSSMVPTLLVGDFIFVNKYSYGLRLPVTNTKVLGIGSPVRGDVVVFRLPSEPSTNYIKRLIGLPGDKIVYRNKRLYINDELVPLDSVGTWEESEPKGATLAVEALGDLRHDVLLMPFQPSMEGTFNVPEGYYFMMGDNRDNSRDSRYPGVGFIPEGNVVGKAVRIWMNWDFPGAPIWRRIGDPIQ